MSVDERGDNNLVVESDRVTIDVLRLNFDTCNVRPVHFNQRWSKSIVPTFCDQHPIRIKFCHVRVASVRLNRDGTLRV